MKFPVVLLSGFLCFYCGMVKAEIPDVTNDGRGGSACPILGPNYPEQMCRPSMLRLAAMPEQYDGKMLAVTGYLVKSDGVMYLCISKCFCTDNDWASSVRLSSSSKIDELLKEGGRVTVVGRFSANPRGGGVNVAGIFLELNAIYKTNGP